MNAGTRTILLSVILIGSANAQYTIDWHTMDGGGATGSGGTYNLTGTVGQPDAGRLSGSGYALEGGFWPGLIVPSVGETPMLFIQFAGSDLVISWFPATPGFVLEQTDSLTGISWAPGPSGNPTAPIVSRAASRFYRLRRP